MDGFGFLSALSGLGAGAFAANRGFNLVDEISEYGNSIYNFDAEGNVGGALNSIGQSLADNSAFKGYGVTTGLGNSGVSIGADGGMNVNLGVGQDGQWLNSANQSLGYANQMSQQAMTDPYARQQQLYEQSMAVQNPMLDQMQAAQQARSYAQGRGGIRGSQFGGSAEDAAMARARVQGSNQALLQAQQMAMAEQAQQGNLASMFNQMGQTGYQTSFLPMQQQMAMMQLAGGDADRYQTGQLTGQGYMGQTAMGGIQAAVNAQKAASELEGNLYDSIFDNAGGLFGSFFDSLRPTPD
jgi:hypothetical protein